MDLIKKSKVLVVDDSAFMRKLISGFFEGNSHIEVIGTARNGMDAIHKIQSLQPDVVTMDVEMPVLNGLDALKEIMAVCPVPVIMLSSTTRQGAENTLKAMEYGAFDFVAKPSGNISLDLHKVKEELIHKVEHAAHVHVAKLQKAKKDWEPAEAFSSCDFQKPVQKWDSPTGSFIGEGKKQNRQWTEATKKVVLIGTSTGGPRALQEVIAKLPATIKAPILIVQHMPEGFTKLLAERLNQLSRITVKEAEQGDVLRNGTAYIAPGGSHLKIKKTNMDFEVVLDRIEPPRSGHRPSVDILFESASRFNDFDKVAVIMTGMGHDGAKGLIKLKQNGNAMAIAQSKKTSIVYGMPKAAVETGLVDEIADIEDIAQAIVKYLR